MLLIFKRFDEYLTLDIDRKKKALRINGEQTNFEKEEQPWRMLWDKCEKHKRNQKEDSSTCIACSIVAQQQDKETESLKDEDFKKVFDDQMQIYGFNLVECQF